MGDDYGKMVLKYARLLHEETESRVKGDLVLDRNTSDAFRRNLAQYLVERAVVGRHIIPGIRSIADHLQMPDNYLSMILRNQRRHCLPFRLTYHISQIVGVPLDDLFDAAPWGAVDADIRDFVRRPVYQEQVRALMRFTEHGSYARLRRELMGVRK